MHMGLIRLVLGIFVGLMLALPAAALEPGEINAPETMASVPDELKPWVPWVLGDYEWQPCPFLHAAPEKEACIWPASLNVEATGNSVRFSMEAILFKEGWLYLPGNKKHWPQEVVVSGTGAAVVAEMDGHPAVFLQPGQYQLQGRFRWDHLPDTLQLPANVGLVKLQVGGAARSFIDVDKQNRLWLRDRSQPAVAEPKGEADWMKLKTFRKLTDSIPVLVETLAILDVSGKQREEVLQGMVLDGFTPMDVTSQLPTRLEADGTLRVLVRPGHHEVRVKAYSATPVNAFTLPAERPGKSKQEAWVFEANQTLRVVQLEGAQPIDPEQTELPYQWRQYPAYLMTPESQLELVVKKRGLEDPETDDLSLRRIWRLDSSGEGYTVQDSMTGKIRQSWRLNAGENTRLGRVAVNGQNQFITTLDGKRAGIEVRPGTIHLEADSRFTASRNILSAVGWEHDMKSLSAELHLPAGWSLFAASGVDKISASWVQGWTLLDVFLVLIAIVATSRMLGLGTAVILGFALVLVHPLLPAVTGFSLTILGAIALLRVLPQGRFFRFVQLARRIVLLLLVLTILPFMVLHMKEALYPQLQREQTVHTSANYAKREMRRERAVAAPMASRIGKQALYEADAVLDMAMPMEEEAKEMVQQLYQYDSNSKVQTGFGVPTRQQSRIGLSWSGPVKSDHTFQLWLISPAMNLFLAICRLILLGLLFMFMLGIPLGHIRPKRLRKEAWQAFAVTLMAGSMLLSAAPASAEVDEYPPAPLLKELRERLVKEISEKPDCANHCAALAHARLMPQADALAIYLQIHAGANGVVVPLPGGVSGWRAEAVSVNGKAANQLRERDGYLEIALPAGVHDVVLTGALPDGKGTVNITFPLKPYFAESGGSGWDVQGIRANGENDGQFQLMRRQTAAPKEAEPEGPVLESRSLPTFFQVSRSFNLGLSWQVKTVVTRLTPADKPTSVTIPLLEGESVISESGEVKNGRITLHFAARQVAKTLTSTISPRERLQLQAEQGVNWVENWQLHASNIWHVEFDGIPRTHTGDAGLPMWHPWPSEEVTILVSRPQGVVGPTLTVDSSHLAIDAGQRAMTATLNIKLRSSMGGQHGIELPENAELQHVKLNGRVEPIQMKGSELTLPVKPGEQRFEVEWQQPQGISARLKVPPVNLNAPSVNSDIELNIPRDRWVLLTDGPRMGPAVLIWGWVPVILLLAFGLAKVPGQPLGGVQWFLLLLGLTQTNLAVMLLVSGWLLALGWRRGSPEMPGRVWFNLRQVVLAAWTLLSLLLLFYGIQHGLLGAPDMKIAGNGSYAYQLKWYQDIAGETLPRPGVVSVSVWWYKGVMLLWALWLAQALFTWLKWGWGCYSEGGYWRKKPAVTKQA